MAGTLNGAYVQAWVWVDADPDLAESYAALSDDAPLAEIEQAFRRRAEQTWVAEGEVEIDTGAAVSLSIEGG